MTTVATVPAAVEAVTFEDYLDAEQVAQVRSEWVAGRVYVMSGGRERHHLATALLLEALAPQVRARGCRPFGEGRLVRLGMAAYHPDFLAVCGRRGHDLYETDLTVVAQVLSPSTAVTDRREKALAYPTARSFEVYLIVDPDRPVVEVGRLGEQGLRWE